MSPTYSNQRVAGKEHIPVYPKGFIAVRIIQLVLAVICLGLCAFGVTYLPLVGACLMIFTAVSTLITSVYMMVSHYGPPKAYNYWAVLGLDIFLVIFWLISFALLAAQVSAIFYYYDSYSYYYYDDEYTDAGITLGACFAAATGLGGVTWILYIVSVAIHGVALHRHRKAGLRCMPSAAPSTGAGSAPTGGEKIQMQPQQTAVYPQSNTPVPQQQMYAPPQQQQNFYQPQQSPSPISSQPTGNSYTHPQNMHPNQPVYEVPGQHQQHMTQ
ncbi:hypothetical protein F5Y15DRAFT_420720 [Xylariaceae sp. FL0016]|nr:hypothetical protein F5Y15DRAFT_420720 [Xylariaceae sp. FL0016]